MKTTYRIAIAELRSLFCSPVAWLILVIFAVQVGVAFGNAFDRQVLSQALGYTLWDVTASIFTGWLGIFPSFLRNLYLYIPLLTMGLMSREYSSGSIKLLFSSPVTDSQIIFGKYLSVLIYNLVLILPLLIIGVFCGITIKDADLGLLFTGILGIYLLICAYGAIGLFMSSITSYQVVAAMGTLAVLAALNYVGEVGQDYAFVRDITYWLSIYGRADEFINGLICSEDLFYFLLIIALFLTLSILKLRAGRRKISHAKIWGTYGIVVLVALLVGYVSTLPTMKMYYDSTATKRNTLTEVSQDIMKKMDGGLKITTYVNLLDDNYAIALPRQLKDDYERLEKYIRFKPDIKLDYVYYYDEANSQLDFRLEGCKTIEERAQKMANILNLDIKMFLTPEQIREQIDLSSEGNRFVRVIERENGQKSVLRLYNDNEKHPSETEISAALKRFIVKSPKVAFLTGHEMRDIHKTGDRDYNQFAENQYFRHSLGNQGFDVVNLSLAEQEVPEDIDIIVIADMKTPFDETENERLNKYIARGGNMFILGDARRQEVMNPIIEQFGVTFMPGTLIDMKENDSPSLIIGRITQEAAQRFKPYARPYEFGYTVTMPDAVGLAFDSSKSFHVSPVIVTDSLCWNELQTTDFLDEKPQFNPETGEKQGIIPTILALDRKVNGKEQRIVITGDADCVSNGEMSKSRNGYASTNFTVITGTFRWLSYDEYPLNTDRPSPLDTEVSIGRDSRKIVRYGCYALLPIILLTVGISILVRRKRR
ncbi:Gldg family protein [Bacteroides thetaiotaomicron]|uniref:Gldg family protein n=1 Tax=Bacteroides thetaiotaomicron TaxID=818 RepID=UPI001F2DE68E|nr:Gldg family protein [Bacteroides thetaiotaomicron]MCE8953305.1 Gldg family protein [Bacteroides thetaiotaomicron]MCE8970908.1 Gldg family protein [Bacteroides thetaiotaomicron]